MSSESVRVLTLVVGMHRSGTSLLASLLQALGADLPGKLISGDIHNPDGYFEWEELVHLQERLLINLGRWWPSADGSQEMPSDWLDHPATVSAKSHLIQMLRPVLAQSASSVVVIKDPRTSRLLPLWISVASDLEIPLQLLLAIRDPKEVVRSLVRRDAAVTGMNVARAQDIWWRFNVEPLHAAVAGSLPIMVIDYSRWFDLPRQQLDRLVTFIHNLKPTEAQIQGALELIRPEHRRSLSKDGEALKLHKRVTSLYQQLPFILHGSLLLTEPPRTLTCQAAKPILPPAKTLLTRSNAWKFWLDYWRHYPAPELAETATLASEAEIWVRGNIGSQGVNGHFWLQKLPISNLSNSELVSLDLDRQCFLVYSTDSADRGPKLSRILINLCPPDLRSAESWLKPLRSAQVIWDPDPARVYLIRALGFPAYWLDPASKVNGWLQRPAAADPQIWSSLLGMPPPTPGAVIVLGDAGHEWNRALAKEEMQELGPSSRWVHPPPVSIDYRPGWFSLASSSFAEAQAQAGWLAAATTTAKALIFTQKDDRSATTELLALCNGAAQFLVIQPPISPARLRAELVKREAFASAEDRPSPPSVALYEWNSGRDAPVAVVVSLYNYTNRILDALNSVLLQAGIDIELIVVDDASLDNGPQVVKLWMQEQVELNSHPFSRLLLLRHERNGGLAATRNTGFANAGAPWCFVLDADNILYPAAIRACFEIAVLGSRKLAVVHPLIAVESEEGVFYDQRSLVAPHSWQRDTLIYGNAVDAMALVRRSAWDAVGGYTHIEGGWEDYDFWCKLIENDFHGIQCPRILAVYRSHADSMSASDTNSSWKPLSRTLSMRHPWLNLPCIDSSTSS